jgi:hypothetical protein
MKKSMIRLLPSSFVLFVLSFVFLTPVRAQLSPAPDGGYTNGNTAEGGDALFSLRSGFDNVAIGYEALYNDTDGIENTGTGYRALYSTTTGTRNTATGGAALSRNITGGSNTATGLHAMFLNTTGQRNTGEGAFALNANTGGSYNIALGYNAGSGLTTGSYNIDIGNVGAVGESGTTRIGASGKQNAVYVAGIYGSMEPNGVNVIIGPNGHLGTVLSSARFKEAIKPMDKASEAILALKPVTFRYKEEFDPDKIPQFGLVAEEVAKVNPDLVVRDDKGEIYTVRYDAVNAMLLNEFLKEHHRVADLEKKVGEQDSLKATIAVQQKQIEALTAGLQKVTGQIQADNATTRVVYDN